MLVAGAIWIFVKLPQEYWIHIAQLDLTDTIRDVPWFLPALVVAVLGLAAVVYFVVRPRLRPADWTWRFRADPLPAEIDEAHERAAYQAAHRKVFDTAALEKIFLIGLISVIYGQVLPGVEASDLELFLGIAVFVVINSAIGLWSAKRGYSWDSAARLVRGRLRDQRRDWSSSLTCCCRGRERRPPLVDTLFFVFLFSILTMLYDRYRPVNEYRAAAKRDAASSDQRGAED